MEKGTHKKKLEELRNKGFVRVKVDDNIYKLDEDILLEKNKKHNISILVDRVVLEEENRSRIFEALNIAMDYGNGLVNIENQDEKKEELFS